jgi:hypothetical protein
MFKALPALTVLMWISSMASGGATFPPDPGSWLDRPLANWNSVGGSLPKPPAAREPQGDLIKRCRWTPLLATPGGSALSAAGWIPMPHFDRQIARGDIEILDGMTAANDQCQPAGFNIFVFVGGRFAGTLSPDPMTSRQDRSPGAVRILNDDSVSAEFLRFTDKDSECCPSSRVTVRFQIDRTRAVPSVTPFEVRTTR